MENFFKKEEYIHKDLKKFIFYRYYLTNAITKLHEAETKINKLKPTLIYHSLNNVYVPFNKDKINNFIYPTFVSTSKD